VTGDDAATLSADDPRSPGVPRTPGGAPRKGMPPIKTVLTLPLALSLVSTSSISSRFHVPPLAVEIKAQINGS